MHIAPGGRDKLAGAVHAPLSIGESSLEQEQFLHVSRRAGELCTAIPVYAAARLRGGLAARLRPVVVPGLLGGVLSVVSYGLVLWAQTRAPLAPVAVLRESSVIAGAAMSVFLFEERFGGARIVAAALMAVGIALMLGTT